MFHFRFTLMVLLFLLASVNTFAGGGRLEINAACVADGCFSNDNPGFPVEINRAGSYVLTSNLVVGDANTTAIDINTANVSLNLNGFSLSGPTSCSGYPVTGCTPTGGGRGIDSLPGTRISNGAVTGFGRYGIYAGGRNRLHNLRVAHNGDDGIYAQTGTSVNNVEAVRNGGAGIYAFTSASMVEVTNSLMQGNGGEGVATTAGVIIDNRIHSNGDYGLRAVANGGINAVAYSGNVFHSNGDSSVNGQVSGGYQTGCNLVVTTLECPAP